MTARRRCTGSDSFGPGFTTSLIPEPGAEFSSDVFSQVALSSSSNVWLGPSCVSQSEAYYKKTDTVIPKFSGISKSDHNSSYYYVRNEQTLIKSPSSAGIDPNHGASDGEYNVKGSDIWKHSNSSNLNDMTCHDRTSEFAGIILSQQGSQLNGTVRSRSSHGTSRNLHQYSDFMQRARLIGRNISSTYAKLEKLTYLAKKRSLFDDSHDREIQELTGIIRHDLNSLTKQLNDLSNKSRTASNGSSSMHLQKHSANLVGSLETKVASIAQKFKSVLEVRTENLKKEAERREQFTGGTVTQELPPAALSGYHHGSVLLKDELSSMHQLGVPSESKELSRSSSEVSINMGGAGYQQQLHLMEEQDTYLQERADTMKTIESTIVELGQMFTQLATMVKEQEELVHRIDANVDDAGLNVEAAHSELLKYFKSVSSNRWLMIKVFGVMVVFFMIFVVFMA